MPNPHEALGLPPGSVRAILALMIIPPVVLGSITLMILMFVQQQYTSALGILSGLTGIAGSVVGYYFGTKTAQKATEEIARAHQLEMQAQHRNIELLSRNLS